MKEKRSMIFKFQRISVLFILYELCIEAFYVPDSLHSSLSTGGKNIEISREKFLPKMSRFLNLKAGKLENDNTDENNKNIFESVFKNPSLILFPSFKNENTEKESLEIQQVKKGQAAIAVEKYFDFWNQRDMKSAIMMFSEDCIYEDTLFPEKFEGREEVEFHLLRCAQNLPVSFRFVIDDIADGGTSAGIKWHVESEEMKDLPFTRGCSFYSVDPESGLINNGFDIPEPTVKSGALSLNLLSSVSKILQEKSRLIPLSLWGLYNYVVFVSNILPGPNAFSGDPDTWREVVGLSLNFWLLAPTVLPNVFPVLDPTLEGVFNFLLAWAALFIGFAIDGRVNGGANVEMSTSTSTLSITSDKKNAKTIKNKSNENMMIPYLIMMQFLTNAIWLPYLAFRPLQVGNKPGNVDKKTISYDPKSFSTIEKIGESKLLPIILTLIGTYAIYWGLEARPEIIDPNLNERWTAFVNIVSKDRLTSSFVVDCVLFGFFQGWLINDDMKRRDNTFITNIAATVGKFLPFYGLSFYLIAREPLTLTKDNKKFPEN